jgi:hypothetical protein
MKRIYFLQQAAVNKNYEPPTAGAWVASCFYDIEKSGHEVRQVYMSPLTLQKIINKMNEDGTPIVMRASKEAHGIMGAPFKIDKDVADDIVVFFNEGKYVDRGKSFMVTRQLPF